jgi:hypothetical protein
MGAGGFNGRVRNGIGWNSSARTTSPAKDACNSNTTLRAEMSSFSFERTTACCSCLALFPDMERGAVTIKSYNRAIRTSKLNTSLCLHTWPIDGVVFPGSQAKPSFEVSFTLRCFQRLSRPYIATRQCGWRHNRSTRGTFLPVLSY